MDAAMYIQLLHLWVFTTCGPALPVPAGIRPATGQITWFQLSPARMCSSREGTPFEPTLSGGPTATIINLHILAGGVLTVNGTGLIQIGGTISNSGIFRASNGAVEFNGSPLQTIAANTFLNNAINDLIITNSAEPALRSLV